MTSVTLVNTVLAIGTEQLTNGLRAWVNFPRELLLEHDFDLLDPSRNGSARVGDWSSTRG